MEALQQTMKDFDQDFSPLARLARHEVTRRTFLTGAATATAVSAFAENGVFDYRLVFNRDNRAAALTVRQDRRRVVNHGTQAQTFESWELGAGGTWTIPSAAFGPNARFRLNKTGTGSPRYKLYITRPEFGRNTGRSLYFEFAADTFEPYTIALWTNLWSLTAGPNQTEFFSLGRRPSERNRDLERRATPVLFSEFASGEKQANLYQWVANGRIASTFQLIFNGLIDTRAASNQNGVFLSFSPECVWRITDSAFELGIADAPPVDLTAFDGEVALKEFRFAWCKDLSARDSLDTLSAQGEAEDLTGAVLLGTGTPLAEIGDVAVPLEERSVTLRYHAEKESDPTTGRRLWVQAGYPPEARDGEVTRGQLEAQTALTGHWSIRLDVAANVEENLPSETFDLPNKLSGVLRQRLSLELSEKGKLDPLQLRTSTFFDADFVSERPHTARTPVGPLLVEGILPERSISSTEDGDQNVAEQSVKAALSASEALAPRRGAAVRLVASRRIENEPVQLRWFEANLHLLEVFRPLKEADFSRLSFAPTSLMVLFAEDDVVPSGYSSFVNLRRGGDSPRAQVDLDRARLAAGGAGNLVHLTFRFQRMALALDTATATIAPLADVCRVTRIDPDEDRDIIANRPEHGIEVNRSHVEIEAREPEGDQRMRRDDRAILVVEFPPQHVLEQAFFHLDPGLPQAMIFASEEDAEFPSAETRTPGQTPINLTRPQEVLEALEAEGTPEKRKAMREAMLRHYRSIVPPADTAAERARKRFDALEEAYRPAATRLTSAPNRLPVDQTVYLGPYGLDADAMGVLRRTWTEVIGALTEQIANEMVKRARIDAENVLKKATARNTDGKARPVDLLTLQHETSFEGAQALAVAVAGAQPDFQRFRTFYREAMIDLFLGELDGHLKASWNSTTLNKAKIMPSTLSAEETEFVWLLPQTGSRWPGQIKADILKTRFDFLFEVYAKDLSGNDNFDEIAEARLARPSRLAFHINCQDRQSLLRSRVSELGGAVADDPDDEGNVADERRRFGVHALDFSLHDLTRWSGFEMSVTRRAQALAAPDRAGRVDALSRRQIDDGGGAILDALGFPSGRHVSSAEWNAHLIGTLKDPPTQLETSIEIPARLALSPDQNAVFLAPQLLDETLRPDPKMQKLWAARLHSYAGPAHIRAVHSPDLRPQVFARSHQQANSGLTVPGLAPPPRGPLAPWLLDRFDGNAEPGGPWDFAKNYPLPIVEDLKKQGQADADLDYDARLCMELAVRDADGKDRLAFPRLVDWLCARRARRKGAGSALRFRSALDAAILHELVLQSSARGMRVVARTNRQGQLIGDSQFLADPRHQLYDLQDGSAIFEPQPFEVEELELTSLGGSYRAMASFEPPAGAKTLDGRPLFPAMSVERYQHWVVLGRDIFVEVLFKGFLLPFGHRASLVQVTERRYMRDPNGNVTAYLVQRMYIQRGTKTVRFPGLGQPYQGRMMPFKNVSILSERSPDIVNPYDDPPAEVGKIGAGGRLSLNGEVGMVGTVFWPRTAKSDTANVRFELQLDDKFSTLPLLFVDNTAANDPKTLRFIVEEYYNKEIPNPHAEKVGDVGGLSGRTRPIDPARHLSTVQLGGGKLRYAEEEKAGSCSFDTESICIFLTGQNGPDGPDVVQEGATGDKQITVKGSRFRLGNYDFSPVLQGADRIPAYPAMETSRLYLRQNERLTGRQEELVRAGFDAKYVTSGLPEIPNSSDGDRVPVEGNLSEVFLSLIDMPSQDMGSKGDQSGGVMRPATNLVALSRVNGPVGVAAKIGENGAKLDPLIYALGERQVFHHTAVLFDARIPVPTPESERAIVASDGGTPALAAASGSPFGEVIEDAKAIYEKYFSDDAKLLGLISIRELVTLVLQLNGDPDLIDPRTGVPKLNELIRYGGGRAQKAVENVSKTAESTADEIRDTAAEGVNFVRVQIVEPLDATLVEVLEVWQETDNRIQEQQRRLGGLVAVVGLDQLLPGMNAALQNLRGAVQQALAETDEILFALSLGSAFEAGRRLIDTIGRVLAEIDEIVADAVGGQIRGVIDQFTPFLDGLDKTLRALAKAVLVEVLAPAMGKPLAETLAQAIVDGGGDTDQIAVETSNWLGRLILSESDEDSAFLAFPAVPLDALDFTGFTLESGRPFGEVLAECVVPTNGEIRDNILVPFFEALMKGTALDEALKDAKAVLVNVHETRMQRVLQELDSAPGDFCGDRITAIPSEIGQIRVRIEIYRRFLEDPEGELKELLGKTTDRAVDVLFRMFKREIDLILKAQERLREAGRSVRDGNVLRAAQSVMAFVELFTGPIFSADDIKDKWVVAIETLTDPVKLVVATGSGSSVGLFNPDQLKSKPTAPCVYDDVSGNASEYEIKSQFSDPDDPEHTISTRIYSAHDVLSDAKEKAAEAKAAFEKFRDEPAMQDILKEASENVDEIDADKVNTFLANTSAAAGRMLNAIEQLRALTGETYCDLVNDSLAADALIKDFDAALNSLKSSGEITLASRMPEKIEALMRSRQRLLSALMVRLRQTGSELRRFFEDEQVQTLLTLGAAGLLADAAGVNEDAIEELLTEMKLKGESVFEDIQDAYDDLLLQFEKFLYQSIVKLENYFGFVIETNAKLIGLAGAGLDSINELISPFVLTSKGNISELEKLQAYMIGLRGAINALRDSKVGTNPKRVTVDEFQGLAHTLGSPRVPMLDFVAPELGKPDFVSILRGLQADVEKVLDGLIDAARDRLRREFEAVLAKLDEPIRKVIGVGISFGSEKYSLVDAFVEIKKARDGFYSQLSNNVASQELAVRFLVPELGTVRSDLGLTLPGSGPQNADRLAADLEALKLLSTASSKPISDEFQRNFLRAFLEEWGESSSTPHLIGKQVLDVIKTALRGEVLKLVPLDQIRDEIEDRILEMVPNQITQSFAFKTNLPQGIEDLTAGIFIPGPGAKLSVGMKIDIDLFPERLSGALEGEAPKVNFNAFGALGAFDIKLVGQFLDALTLHFDGARFTMSSGEQRRFDVAFRDFTIGRDLEFVAELAEMLSPGGSGPYVVPAQGFPGIEAGYGLNIGTFMIGNMSVFNVSLNAAAVLPFDSNPTRFRSSLSRRDAPFTLSYAPYGGSGFFGLEADADGIVGFEASFEFGGAAAFAIGPLTGQGRAMAGFYIRQTRVGGRRMTELAATVFIGGSANIWIFSFGASLYIRLGMLNGNMTGLAVFTYSFSIGIKDFDFTIEWRKEEGKGFSGEQASLADPFNPTRFANLDGGIGGSETIDRGTVCQSQNWPEYQKYFDKNLDQKEFLDGYFA